MLPLSLLCYCWRVRACCTERSLLLRAASCVAVLQHSTAVLECRHQAMRLSQAVQGTGCALGACTHCTEKGASRWKAGSELIESGCCGVLVLLLVVREEGWGDLLGDPL